MSQAVSAREKKKSGMAEESPLSKLVRVILLFLFDVGVIWFAQNALSKGLQRGHAMSIDRLLGPEKAAILLYSLGEEMASNIVKQLSEEEIKKLGSSMSKVFSITSKTVESIYSEFNEMASSPVPVQIGLGGTQFIKNVLTKAVEKEKAQTILEEIQEEAKWNLFQKIKKLDPKTLANFIRNVHPQTIAIILAHLHTSQTAGALAELPPALHTELIHRMAELENVPHAIVEEIVSGALLQKQRGG